MGWLIYKKNPKVIEAGKKLDLSDLTNDPVVAFQKKIDPFFPMFMCFVFPVLVSSYGWNENVIPSFLVAGSLRYCTVLLGTWVVNSAASNPWAKRLYNTTKIFILYCVLSFSFRVFLRQCEKRQSECLAAVGNRAYTSSKYKRGNE